MNFDQIADIVMNAPGIESGHISEAHKTITEALQ